MDSALEIRLSWGAEQASWIRPALPPLQHLCSAIWQARQDKVATDLCKRKEFRSEFCFDIYGSHQLLASSHLRKPDKVLLRAILSGVVWNVFFFCPARPKKKTSVAGFAMLLKRMATFLWIAPFPLLWKFATPLSLFP